jgi:hypothetical protein
VEPDLYRLVFGAGDTLWAHNADLEFALRGHPPSGSPTVPEMNLGKTITLPGSVASLNVGFRTWANAGAARGERRHKQPGQPRACYLKLHEGFLLSTPLAGDFAGQAP